MAIHSPIVVLGGGPGGYAAAFLAADMGLQVTIVEASPRLGGTCLLEGCIPSKALLHVARFLAEAEEMTEWGVSFAKRRLDIDVMRDKKEQVIAALSGGLEQLAKRRDVKRIHARGIFVDSQTLQLEGVDPDHPVNERLTFEHCIVATGSRPVVPELFALKSDRVIDSSGALELRDVPDSLLVIGAGYIGLEMGTVYAHLGSKVTVVELTDKLLPGADRDLVKPLARRLKKLFSAIHLETKVTGLKVKGERVEVAVEGKQVEGPLAVDRVLVAIGRRPNSNGLGLENTDVEIDRRGFIQVDDRQQTADPHILAIGDVVGEPMLAHKAAYEGKVAAEFLAGEPAVSDARAIPAVVFTDPEIAWTGLTVEQAEREGREFEVASYPWQASGRAHANSRTDGLTKWIVEPRTGRVLGCGIVGAGAGELISEAVLAIEMGCTVRDLAATIHPHPTMSETLAFAGEVHLGTATEIYHPKKRAAAALS